MAPKYYPKGEVFIKGGKKREKREGKGKKGGKRKKRREKEGEKWEKEKRGGGEEKNKAVRGVEQPSCRWQQINIHPSVHRHWEHQLSSDRLCVFSRFCYYFHFVTQTRPKLTVQRHWESTQFTTHNSEDPALISRLIQAAELIFFFFNH